jgi:uncharacterized repeat protein (TIGR04138 family)
MEDSAELLAKIETIASQSGDYSPQAYLFVLESLEMVLARLGERRHVSGEDLLEGIKDLAKDRFGPMAKDVLNSWEVHTTLDFGRIVFHLVEAGLLSKTPEDSLSDFIDKYDFTQEFEANYFGHHTS